MTPKRVTKKQIVSGHVINSKEDLAAGIGFESRTWRAFVRRSKLAKRLVSFTVVRIVNVMRELINPDTAGQTAARREVEHAARFAVRIRMRAHLICSGGGATVARHYIVNYISLGVTLTAATSRC